MYFARIEINNVRMRGCYARDGNCTFFLAAILSSPVNKSKYFNKIFIVYKLWWKKKINKHRPGNFLLYALNVICGGPRCFNSIGIPTQYIVDFENKNIITWHYSNVLYLQLPSCCTFFFHISLQQNSKVHHQKKHIPAFNRPQIINKAKS